MIGGLVYWWIGDQLFVRVEEYFNLAAKVETCTVLNILSTIPWLKNVLDPPNR